MTATKAEAWDGLGLKFWRQGRRTAKPPAATVRWFVDGLADGSRCLVVGGTSVSVIRAAAATGAAVTVADFSRTVCAECRSTIGDIAPVVQADVLAPGPALEGPFDRIACDTLVNRFDAEEAERFAASVAALLAPGGSLRATVKLGLYAMDSRLIELAGGPDGAAHFWDEATRTIDYSRVGDLLEPGLVAHGGIAREDLLAWYGGRGREKRFDEDDLRALLRGDAWASCSIELDDEPAGRVRLEGVRSAAPAPAPTPAPRSPA